MTFQKHRYEFKCPSLQLWHSKNTDLNSNTPPTALAFQIHRFEFKCPCLLLWHSKNTDLSSNIPAYCPGIPKTQI
jgi:hypothetical protein